MSEPSSYSQSLGPGFLHLSLFENLVCRSARCSLEGMCLFMKENAINKITYS